MVCIICRIRTGGEPLPFSADLAGLCFLAWGWSFYFACCVCNQHFLWVLGGGPNTGKICLKRLLAPQARGLGTNPRPTALAKERKFARTDARLVGVGLWARVLAPIPQTNKQVCTYAVFLFLSWLSLNPQQAARPSRWGSLIGPFRERKKERQNERQKEWRNARKKERKNQRTKSR